MSDPKPNDDLKLENLEDPSLDEGIKKLEDDQKTSNKDSDNQFVDDATFIKEHGIEGFDNMDDFMEAAKTALAKPEDKKDFNNLSPEDQERLTALTNLAASKGQTLDQYISSGGSSKITEDNQFNIDLGFNSPKKETKDDYLPKKLFSERVDALIKSGRLSEKEAAGYQFMASINDDVMSGVFDKLEHVMSLLLTNVSSLQTNSLNNEYQMFPKEIRSAVPKGTLDLMMRKTPGLSQENATIIYLTQNKPELLQKMIDRNKYKGNPNNLPGSEDPERPNRPFRKTKSSAMESNVQKIEKSGVLNPDGTINNEALHRMFPKTADQITFLKSVAQTHKT